MKKYYFCEQIDEGFCFTLDYFIRYMKEEEISEIEIVEAVRDVGSDYFYCKEFSEVGEKSEGGCGKFCESYLPRNGKNGICKHWGYVRSFGESEYILKANGVLTPIIHT